ncbi:MAG: zinc-binding dehydrogenase [Planctomycetota bacterium]|nr:zinc-binding dehydrogenase [Planctomycetota bacterium]
MKRVAAKLVGPKKFDFFEEDIPVLADGEMLIRLRAAGLCHSDLPPYLGIGASVLNRHGYHVMTSSLPYPYPLGHEPLGVVEEIGRGVKDFRPGDAVGGMAHGAFATHIVTTGLAMAKVDPNPAKLPLAEPMMCVANIARIARPEFGDRVAVIGCGYMGLLVIQALAGANIETLAAIDLLDNRLELAKKYGASLAVNPAREDLEDAAFAATGGRMFDVVVEITGSLRGFDGAMSIIRLADRIGPKGQGRLILPSVYAKEEKWSLGTGWNLMLRSPIIHVAHPRYATDLQDVLERGIAMYNLGRLKSDELISHRIPFPNIGDGFEILASGSPDYLKGVVVF